MKLNNVIQTSLFAMGMSVFATSAHAALVTFDFENSTGLDGNAAAGATMSVSENGETVLLTTIELEAPDFNEADPYSNIITAGVDSSIGTSGGLGINNPSTNNSNFNTATGAGGSEGNNINFLESITFHFDHTVMFTSIDFASLNAGGVEFARINVEGNGTNFDFFDDGSADTFTNPLGALVIPAGTDITVRGLGGIGDTNLRLDEFTVDVVPEPSSAALLGLGGLALIMRRRK